MELRVVRKNLLAQHEHLRGLMKALESALDTKADRATLDAHVKALHDAVLVHNAAEEGTLRPILETIDAWGPERVKTMLEEHKQEHAFIVEGLAPNAKEAAIREVLAHIAGHMAHEEQGILSERLLRDDVITLDVETG